ncbi:putative ISXO2-like transposase domain [Monocercomonoides exilis]|uniref:putative ISXO2-like transposase domain n=1 Tax=Monocercomonoides exilis TaxID=2049356 RepID=UPI00355A1E6C|nr:putative ISXO2-like transposase domain [Monocercomonoides exilis]|eukprot:MONOS_5545.1-p1 / transcript=MONOS_5545.1 / gene=MONOS_5545 / organism=Monocercomonoides_exilis_PA203 / gene_product=unspecified product / transcript_product=unspecified product / location=Mono_scaffold00162:103074-103532(+) / protein_length=152 / sequence_SO=supercontig / SO=protein_coding / is_pseudo=false
MIISDEWTAYSCLESIGYEHQTVCHKKEYVNKETHACTNTIEGLWSHFRSSFPRFGTRKKFISDHIAMYLVKSSMKLSFLELMKHVSKYKPEKEIEEKEQQEEEEDDDDEIDEDVPFIEDILGNDENETDKKLEEDDSDGAGYGDSASEYSP